MNRDMFSIVATLAVALVIAGGLAALGVGVLNWRRTWGKALSIGAAAVLAGLVLVVVAVIFTVWSGSMG